MNKIEEKAKFVHYLKVHGINYVEHRSEGSASIAMVFKGCKHCTDSILEGCVYFLILVWRQEFIIMPWLHLG